MGWVEVGGCHCWQRSGMPCLHTRTQQPGIKLNVSAGQEAEGGTGCAHERSLSCHCRVLTQTEPALQDKKEKEELDARVKLLSELDEKYEDLGACHVQHRPQASSSGVAAPGVQGCTQSVCTLGMRSARSSLCTWRVQPA